MSAGFVQKFTYQTAAASAEQSATLNFGTSGSAATAPLPRNGLIVFCVTHAFGQDTTPTLPAGWQHLGAVTDESNSGWTQIDAYALSPILIPASGPPASVTFANLGGVGWGASFELYGFELSAMGGMDILTSAHSASATLQSSTGTGTSTETGDIQLICCGISGVLFASTPSGYTLVATMGNHGDGSNSFGGTSTSDYNLTATVSTTVAATTVTWTGDTGTKGLTGMKILITALKTSSLSASVGSTGKAVRRAGAVLAGAWASTGAMGPRGYGRQLAGVVTSFSSFTKQISVVISASIGSVGATSRELFNTAFSGVWSSSGAISRKTGKTEAGVVTSGGSIRRASVQILAGTVTFSALITRASARTLVGATWSATGALRRAITYSMAGVLTSTGSENALTRVFFAGVESFSAALGQGNTYARSLAASIGSSGSIARQTGVSIAGVVTSGASIGRAIGAVLTAGITGAGNVTRFTTRTFASVWTSTGLLSGGSRTFTVALAATMDTVAALTRQAQKTFTGSVDSSGSVGRQVGVAVAGVVTSGAALERDVAAVLTGALTPAGSIVRQAQKAFVATVAPQGSMQRAIAVRFGAAIAPIGAFISVSPHIFFVTLSASIGMAGGIRKSIGAFFTAVINAVGSLLTPAVQPAGVELFFTLSDAPVELFFTLGDDA